VLRAGATTPRVLLKAGFSASRQLGRIPQAARGIHRWACEVRLLSSATCDLKPVPIFLNPDSGILTPAPYPCAVIRDITTLEEMIHAGNLEL
jgi:hypothetical protein